MPTYHIMDLKKNMTETAAEYMPTAAEVAANKWFTDEDVAVYASERARRLAGRIAGLSPRTRTAQQR